MGDAEPPRGPESTTSMQHRRDDPTRGPASASMTVFSSHAARSWLVKLRVGGSNHMRRVGISNDVHKRMGGWMTLTAAQGYMALSPEEQFAYTLKLAKAKKRESGLTEAVARQALGSVAPMLL